MTLLTSCPACGRDASDAKPFGHLGGVDAHGGLAAKLIVCPCGHGFSNPQPDWEELAPFYDAGYHVFADRGAASRVDRLIAERYDGATLNHAPVVPGGRYLDIGCGLGEMVAGMARLGVDARGVEPSPIAAKKASDSGLNVFCGMLEEAGFADETFDCASMYHVLEHASDPVSLLRECRRILKPGGILVVGVPNLDSAVLSLVGATWGGLDLPRHLHQFRPASIAKAAGRAGLEVASIRTESLVEHVEKELVVWLKRRLHLPVRVTTAIRVARPLASHLARKGNSSGRGEAIVALLKRPDTPSLEGREDAG